MSIYDLDRESLRKQFYEFQKSLYGRTVFFFAYFIPFVLFITAALSALFAIFYSFDIALLNVAAATIVLFVPSFILGNMYFYSEIRKFINYRARNPRQKEKK